MAAFTLLAVILILFGRPFVGLGIFVTTVVTCLMVCLYDHCRVDRAYEAAIENLKSVVKKINEEGWIMVEDCGVLLSVVLTGPTSSRHVDGNDNNINGEENNNIVNTEKRRNNNITNVYIECKRISNNSHRHQGNDDNELLVRSHKQPIIVDDTIVYNGEDESFSC